MGTSNYHNIEADNIYVISDNTEYTIDVVSEELATSAKQYADIDWYPSEHIKFDRELRSFPISPIGVLQNTIYLLDNLSIYITFRLGLVSGYYENANLEYEFGFELELDCTIYNSIDELMGVLDMYKEDYDIPEFVFELNISDWITKLESAFNETKQIIEDVYKNNSEPLYK